MPRPRARLLAWLLPLLLLVPAAPPQAEDKQSANAAPKGEVTKYTFDHSKIFPGTVRDYWVYVPKQYDPAKPAAATESTSAN